MFPLFRPGIPTHNQWGWTAESHITTTYDTKLLNCSSTHFLSRIFSPYMYQTQQFLSMYEGGCCVLHQQVPLRNTLSLLYMVSKLAWFLAFEVGCSSFGMRACPKYLYCTYLSACRPQYSYSLSLIPCLILCIPLSATHAIPPSLINTGCSMPCEVIRLMSHGVLFLHSTATSSLSGLWLLLGIAPRLGVILLESVLWS